MQLIAAMRCSHAYASANANAAAEPEYSATAVADQEVTAESSAAVTRYLDAGSPCHVSKDDRGQNWSQQTQ